APGVPSCTVTVDQDLVEAASRPEAADSLTYAAFGEGGTREFFTHVRFHKHDEDKITIHLLVELYARSPEEAGEVLEEAGRGGAGGTLRGGGRAPPRGRVRGSALKPTGGLAAPSRDAPRACVAAPGAHRAGGRRT